MFSKSILVAMSLASVAAFAQEQQTKVLKHYDSHLYDYTCTVNEYVSEKQSDKKLLKTIYVHQNKASDPVPAAPVVTSDGANTVGWAITRYDGMMSAEVRNAKGEVVTISTVKDGKALGIKVPSMKAILTCNPPISASLSEDGDFKKLERLNVDPTAYGESITVNPMKYGSYLQMIKVGTLKGLGLTPEEKAKIRELDQQQSQQKVQGSTK